MRIKVPPAAVESGALRIWLRRIPVSSASLHAFRLGPDGQAAEEVASADMYGRGEGSTATERTMLLFRFRDGRPHAGEELELCVAKLDGDGYMPAELDILEVR